jgi:hypothetical protein
MEHKRHPTNHTSFSKGGACFSLYTNGEDASEETTDTSHVSGRYSVNPYPAAQDSIGNPHLLTYSYSLIANIKASTTSTSSNASADALPPSQPARYH